ncbi:MAG: endonuclease/exonuclease/phosphatase family protein [Shewanella sp.]|nr:endonuclease/exonuclease/phosphatase family protein [Shewanella sp.]MCF1430069.1 endonuclease/exonuclease/phosphatase family protein [Shewanella sp.]MCF1438979.1 endonuclease/exonuclease/phosphatase family protein [Shewanella sp.]MCF1456363.1 endonuclease/exonuclease/phosphatase family protein [Shewanella sp.]
MKKKVSAIFAMLTLTGFISLSWIFERYPASVTSNIVVPDFHTGCRFDSSTASLDEDGTLTVAVWNIYKQQNEGWQAELKGLIDSSQLVLLQEASLTPLLKAYFADHSAHISMVRAFTGFDIANGVMDIARVAPLEVCGQLTTEPLIRLPKSALVSTYPLSTGKSLLVVNLHGVNFSWGLGTYKQQLSMALEEVAAHLGPVIVGGDFNTWRSERTRLVKDWMTKLGMKEVDYRQDARSQVFGMPLDHLFYRDLTLEKANARPTEASDHNPIQARFRLQ